ncbi:AraC family transcriptional regulator [Bacteroidia bacterium]|nr:AraC family transcriptional regulator [Bacteroidia bacterium]
MERINSVVDYINKQVICDWSKQDQESFAKNANIPNIIEHSDKVVLTERYFQQFFRLMTGEPIGAYINRLRLERAAFLLQNTHKSIADIASTVGYTSENAFFKRFKEHFKLTPKKYRDRYVEVLPSPSEQEYLSPEGHTRIVSEQHLIYRSYTGYYSQCNDLSFDTEYWDSLYEYATQHHILQEEPAYYGICFDESNIRKPDRCRFYACMSVSEPQRPNGIIGAMTIKPGKYIVYKHIGSYTQLETFYKSIFHSFRYELRDDFILEHYLNGPQDVSEESLETEVMIPIR